MKKIILLILIIAVFGCSSSDNNSTIHDNSFYTENGTNYLPIYTERWTNFEHPGYRNAMYWSGGTSTLNFSSITGAYEGNSAWQLIYDNNSGGWWGHGLSFVTTNGSYTLKRTDMTKFWNWNLSFSIKGSPISSTNVKVCISSGIYQEGDNLRQEWSLAELGYTGTGAWETLSVNFSTVTNILWSESTFLFIVEGIANQTGSDTIIIDDIYWWIESANHGAQNTNPLPHSFPYTVNTNVDTNYVITYEKTKYVPPAGKVLFIAGQDKINIPLYVNNVGPAGGYASYFAVCTTHGITNDTVDGGNVQNVSFPSANYPNSVAQTAMWMVGTNGSAVDYCGNTTNGVYDNVLDTFCNWAKSVDIPIYLRIGYEFDGVHNKLHPTEYKNAYRYITDYIRTQNVSNVAFVWHSYASVPYNGYPVIDWYPGDDYVDWVGISVFSSHFVNGVAISYLEDVIDLAKTLKKPVMIAEATPHGGIVPDNYKTWNDWFVTVFNYIYKKNIKAYSYINCDWAVSSTFTPDWGNTKIQDFPLILEQWTNEINKPRYLKSSPTLFSELGH